MLDGVGRNNQGFVLFLNDVLLKGDRVYESERQLFHTDLP